jgi:uncharacterized membrane protein
MTDLIVLGFPSRELAEDARRRSVELADKGALDLNGAALAYRRDDGNIELVQPLHLAKAGTVAGAVGGGLMGLVVLAPLLMAAIGAAAGAVGAELSAGILNAMFVRGLKEVLEPGRAALFLVVKEAVDPSKTIDALRPLSPRVLRTNWSEADEQRLIAALAEDVKGGQDAPSAGQR